MNRRIQLSKSPATDPNTHAGAPTHFQPQPKQKRLPGLRTPLANGADYTNEPENLKKKNNKKHTHIHNIRDSRHAAGGGPSWPAAPSPGRLMNGAPRAYAPHSRTHLARLRPTSAWSPAAKKK